MHNYPVNIQKNACDEAISLKELIVWDLYNLFIIIVSLHYWRE